MMQSIEIHIETLLRRHPELAPTAPAIRETIETILAAFRAGGGLFGSDHIIGPLIEEEGRVVDVSGRLGPAGG